MGAEQTPRIIVHGGAGNWSNMDHDAVQKGVRVAALAGWDVLKSGGTALDAVEQATMLLEDDPLFDAGYGSFVNEAGEVEMDALVCDGEAIRFGAVAAVRRVRHAISLARLVMTRTDNCFFVGEGADLLAAHLGMPLVANIELVTEAEFASFSGRSGLTVSRAGLGTGTVGAVARDVAGRLASATSTGGTPDKRKGRVGDSPMFGAGGYADSRTAAVSATGRGENIMRFFLSKGVSDAVAAGNSAPRAVRSALEQLIVRIPDPEAGVIAVAADGSLAALHTTPAMPIAWLDESGTVRSRMVSDGALD